MADFNPCPFDSRVAGCCVEDCGPPEIHEKDVSGTAMHFAYCSCGARGPLSPTPEYAAMAWNRRTLPWRRWTSDSNANGFPCLLIWREHLYPFVANRFEEGLWVDGNHNEYRGNPAWWMPLGRLPRSEGGES